MTIAILCRGSKQHQGARHAPACLWHGLSYRLITQWLAVRRCLAVAIAAIAQSPLSPIDRSTGSSLPRRLRRCCPGDGPRARLWRSAQDGTGGHHARRLGRLQPAQPEGMPACRTPDAATAVCTGRGGGPSDAADHLHAGPGRGVQVSARPPACGSPCGEAMLLWQRLYRAASHARRVASTELDTA